MKRAFAVLFVVALATIMFFANACAEETANQDKLGLNKEQSETLKKQLAGMAEVFGVEQPKPQQTQSGQNQQQTPEQKKTVADVADKALDMVNKMVTDTAATLQKVAPDVWRIMMKQQYANAIADLITPWGLVMLSVFYIIIFRKTFGAKWEPETGEGAVCKKIFGYIAPTVLAAISGFIGVFYLSSSVRILINPEFYAIKNLILILLGKG